MSIRFDVLSLNRVGEESQSLAPMSALPIGHTRSIKDTQLVEVEPETDVGELLSKVCALPQIEGERKRKEKKADTALEEPATVVKEATTEAEEVKPEKEGAEVKEEEGTEQQIKKEEEASVAAATDVAVGAAEVEEQDMDEEAQYAEDAEIAASPVLGFVHM